MAKSKKKHKSHKGPPKPFRRRWAEIKELLGPEHMKEVQEIFCEADCPFFGECKGYELTKFCRLKAWGRYDKLFERAVRFNVCREKKIEFRPADDILLRRWDDEDADGGYQAVVIRKEFLDRIRTSDGFGCNFALHILAQAMLRAIKDIFGETKFMFILAEDPNGLWRLALANDPTDTSTDSDFRAIKDFASLSGDEVRALLEEAGTCYENLTDPFYGHKKALTNDDRKDDFCRDDCMFSSVCEGWRHTNVCMLKESGDYPEFLDD